MGPADFDLQWRELTETSPFAEEVIVNGSVMRGIVYAGTYRDSKAAPYSPARYDRRTFVKLPRLAVEDAFGREAYRTLVGADVSLRGMVCRVADISGGINSDYALMLSETEEEGNG